MISKRELGKIALKSTNFKDFCERLVKKYSLQKQEDSLKSSLIGFYYKFVTLWKNSRRNEKNLERKHCKWLDGIIDFSAHSFDNPGPSTVNATPIKRGRPKKSFDEGSDRTKRRIIKRGSDSCTTPEAIGVLSSRLRQKGNRAGECILKLVTSSTPKSSKKNLQIIRERSRSCKSYSPEEALSLLIETKLSKQSYEVIRKSARERNSDIYPHYKKLGKAKKLCYPENIKCSETNCEVPLQELLDHTTKRILQTLKTPIVGNYILLCKWGFDGSSGQSQYKQAWLDEKSSSDESVFVTSMVPLALTGNGTEVWRNPRPSSTRYCRPIRLQFIHENREAIKEEEKYIQKQIMDLKSYKDSDLEIRYDLFLTMVDGKVVSALTNTSTQQCHICKQTAKGSSSWMISKPADAQALKYGISPLHAYIRFLEFILQISYRLGMKLDCYYFKKRIILKHPYIIFMHFSIILFLQA